MTWNGAPVLDGVEMDTVWDSETPRCAFAHDIGSAIGAADVEEATQEVAQHLRDTADATGERRFFVKIEQKPGVAPDGHEHTEADRAAHADCSLDMYEMLADAATEAGRALTVLFESEDPDLTLEVTRRPRYPGKRKGEQVQTGLVIALALTPPEGLEVDVVTLNWEEAHNGQGREFQDLRDRGIAIMLWMYDASIEILGKINHVGPDFVTTSEAALLREWLGPPIED